MTENPYQSPEAEGKQPEPAVSSGWRIAGLVVGGLSMVCIAACVLFAWIAWTVEEAEYPGFGPEEAFEDIRARVSAMAAVLLAIVASAMFRKTKRPPAPQI